MVETRASVSGIGFREGSTDVPGKPVTISGRGLVRLVSQYVRGGESR